VDSITGSLELLGNERLHWWLDPLIALKLSRIPLSTLYRRGGRVRVWMGEGWFLEFVLFLPITGAIACSSAIFAF
jgi:hypothetical protein